VSLAASLLPAEAEAAVVVVVVDSIPGPGRE
jgi:hypothetical protein